MLSDTENRAVAPIASTDTINLIVARYPQALPILQRFGLDACCGGALRLRDAARRHQLDADEVLAALRAAVGEELP
jgi:iron-sulfur cluster repair protein YtfE (RIC family)